MRISDSTVYLTDGGAAYCGQHLGSTARHTGRDISGQEILPITLELVREFHSLYGSYLACESCGRRATALHVVQEGGR